MDKIGLKDDLQDPDSIIITDKQKQLFKCLQTKLHLKRGKRKLQSLRALGGGRRAMGGMFGKKKKPLGKIKPKQQNPKTTPNLRGKKIFNKTPVKVKQQNLQVKKVINKPKQENEKKIVKKINQKELQVQEKKKKLKLKQEQKQEQKQNLEQKLKQEQEKKQKQKQEQEQKQKNEKDQEQKLNQLEQEYEQEQEQEEVQAKSLSIPLLLNTKKEENVQEEGEENMEEEDEVSEDDPMSKIKDFQKFMSLVKRATNIKSEKLFRRKDSMDISNDLNKSSVFSRSPTFKIKEQSEDQLDVDIHNKALTFDNKDLTSDQNQTVRESDIFLPKKSKKMKKGDKLIKLKRHNSSDYVIPIEPTSTQQPKSEI